MFNIGDRVMHTRHPEYGIGFIKDNVTSSTYDVDFWKFRTTIHERDLSEVDSCGIIICSECGQSFTSSQLNTHIYYEHGQKEAEDFLIQRDKELQSKADQYDRICNTLFMATGMVKDGDSINYIVDPETVCDEVLKIILNDISVDRDRIVKVKRDHYTNKGIKMEGW